MTFCAVTAFRLRFAGVSPATPTGVHCSFLLYMVLLVYKEPLYFILIVLCIVPEYICIIKLLYTASLPELLAQFLATVTQQLVDKASSYPCASNLLHKPILTACPCLNRPTRASVLSGYTDSVINKVLILPLKQVH